MHNACQKVEALLSRREKYPSWPQTWAYLVILANEMCTQFSDSWLGAHPSAVIDSSGIICDFVSSTPELVRLAPHAVSFSKPLKDSSVAK